MCTFSQITKFLEKSYVFYCRRFFEKEQNIKKHANFRCIFFPAKITPCFRFLGQPDILQPSLPSCTRPSAQFSRSATRCRAEPWPAWPAGRARWEERHQMAPNRLRRRWHCRWCRWLGGGVKDFLFSPRTLGKWSNLTIVFFKWVVETTT